MDPEQLTDIALDEPTGLPLGQNRKSRKKLWFVSAAVALLMIGGGGGAVAWWWQQAQQPVDSNNLQKQLVKVPEGATVTSVAASLQQQGLIRDAKAFSIYARWHHTVVHAGAYMVAPSASMPAIADKIGRGDTDSFDLSLSPGLTLAEIKKALEKSGFEAQAIDQALTESYNIPVLASRPAGNSLEGYVMGYAQKFSADATPRDIIKTAIEGLNSYIKKEQLEAGFKAQGLSLYQGLILASIVQKEVADPADMAHVAQVFYTRLAKGMPLGSDATFVYGARLKGVAPATDLDSQYNTRIHTGLPPTPIANPGEQALYATAHPSNTDDLFFVSGDDGKTYFSKTNEQHDAYVEQYCHVNCQLPQN